MAGTPGQEVTEGAYAGDFQNYTLVEMSMSSHWEEEVLMAACTFTHRPAVCLSSHFCSRKLWQSQCKGLPSFQEDLDHTIACNRASRTNIQDKPTFR